MFILFSYTMGQSTYLSFLITMHRCISKGETSPLSKVSLANLCNVEIAWNGASVVPKTIVVNLHGICWVLP